MAIETPTDGEMAVNSLARPLTLAALAALALAANVVEGYLTLPLPIIRLGVANAFILIALWKWGPADALLVAASKTLGAALILGTLATPVFALNGGGTLAAWLCMSAVAIATGRRRRAVVVASALGGLAHAAWQVLYLQWLTGNTDVLRLGSFLLPLGLAAGVVVGILTLKLLAWEKVGA
jgi:heptaprenyl diphosphate synthase